MRDRETGAQALYHLAVERLIAHRWHDELRRSLRQRSGDGTDAAMVDQRLRAGQEQFQRSVGQTNTRRVTVFIERRRVFRKEDAAQAERAAGVPGRAEVTF